MGFTVGDYKEINYGLQFEIFFGEHRELLRIYESKKGTSVDMSQVREPEIKELLQSIEGTGSQRPGITKGVIKSKGADDLHDDPDELIGTDESGKGDYFGPLVVAGVFVNPGTSEKLKELGVDDSKKLSDSKISKMAPVIRELCPYSVVVLGCQKYNELYAKVKNLNRLLAWAHARAIENVLNLVECSYALSDQFGDPSLIKNALMDKGRKITLSQRPRAEENISVAAASVLARDEYVARISELGEKYGMEFPKGASQKVEDTARKFVERFGREELSNAAKLHFKTTLQL